MWKYTTLEDSAFTTINGLWTGKSAPFVSVKVLRNTNFRNDGVLNFDDVAILDVEAKSFSKKRLHKGDIIIERSGGGPKQPVGRVCLFDPHTTELFSLSNFTTALRVVERSRFLPRFVCYYLLYLYRTGYTEALQRATTGIRNLDFSAYLQTEIPEPPIEEQQGISSILRKIQQAIEVETNLIRVTRELKAAVMKKLFTEGLKGEPQKETEAGMVPESWTLAPLGDYFGIKHGFAFSGEHFRPAGKYVLMTPGHFHEEGGFRDQGSKTKYYVGEIPAGYLLSKGDLLVAMTEQKAGLNGSPAFVPTADCFLHNQRLGLIENLSPRLDKRFLYHLFNTAYVRTEIARSASGSKVKHTSPSKIRAVRVAIPSTIGEQIRIADILDALDASAQFHISKELSLSELFNVLLSKFMSGTVRIDQLDLSSACFEPQGVAA